MDSQTPTAEQPAETSAPAHPWQDLPAEPFQLLRLAPLSTDRNTGARPLRFVQLRRGERHSPEQSLLRLEIDLPGQKVRREQNILDVWVDHRSREVRFADDKGLQIEPVNRGLGRYLAAHSILWARQYASGYKIEGGALSLKDGFSDDARMRRDHFLRAQGFDVDYQDPLQLKGSYSAKSVSALSAEWTHEKVQIVELLDAAAMLQQADQTLREQEVKIGKLEQRIDQFKRDDSSLRFTIASLVVFAVFQASLLIWIATH